MSFAPRLVIAVFTLALLSGCAAGGATSGVGMDRTQLATVEPSATIGNGPLTPQSLLGVAPSALSSRLGVPDFRRVEPDAEVWQYGGGDCALFVYFYKTPRGSLASSYVDARKTRGGAADTSACLADVLQGKGKPVS